MNTQRQQFQKRRTTEIDEFRSQLRKSKNRQIKHKMRKKRSKISLNRKENGESARWLSDKISYFLPHNLSLISEPTRRGESTPISTV